MNRHILSCGIPMKRSDDAAPRKAFPSKPQPTPSGSAFSARSIGAPATSHAAQPCAASGHGDSGHCPRAAEVSDSTDVPPRVLLECRWWVYTHGKSVMKVRANPLHCRGCRHVMVMVLPINCKLVASLLSELKFRTFCTSVYQIASADFTHF